MRNETWLQAFDHALEAQGLPSVDRAELVVELDGFLVEADGAAIEHFGAPTTTPRRSVPSTTSRAKCT